MLFGSHQIWGIPYGNDGNVDEDDDENDDEEDDNGVEDEDEDEGVQIHIPGSHEHVVIPIQKIMHFIALGAPSSYHNFVNIV